MDYEQTLNEALEAVNTQAVQQQAKDCCRKVFRSRSLGAEYKGF